MPVALESLNLEARSEQNKFAERVFAAGGRSETPYVVSYSGPPPHKWSSPPLVGVVQGVSGVFGPCLPRFLNFGPVYDPCTTCVRDGLHRCKVHGYIGAVKAEILTLVRQKDFGGRATGGSYGLHKMSRFQSVTCYKLSFPREFKGFGGKCHVFKV